jgi:Family of unknown function (DUF6074)
MSNMETAEVLPFPATRRVGFIRKMAAVLATYSREGAEKTLAVRLDTARSVMLRKGIAPDVVEREVRALELAIRARLCVVVMQGGDVA